MWPRAARFPRAPGRDGAQRCAPRLQRLLRGRCASCSCGASRCQRRPQPRLPQPPPRRNHWTCWCPTWATSPKSVWSKCWSSPATRSKSTRRWSRSRPRRPPWMCRRLPRAWSRSRARHQGWQDFRRWSRGHAQWRGRRGRRCARCAGASTRPAAHAAAAAARRSASVRAVARGGLPTIDEASFGKAHAGPSVRKLARELGVDLGRREGHGSQGPHHA